MSIDRHHLHTMDSSEVRELLGQFIAVMCPARVTILSPRARRSHVCIPIYPDVAITALTLR